MKIITLTLNPAFDIHCDGASLVAGKENFAHIRTRSIGGKGVNISRALTSCGMDSLAYVLLGEENCEEFKKALEDEKIRYEAITVPGRIRENITHRSLSVETRLSFPGFFVFQEDFCRLLMQ